MATASFIAATQSGTGGTSYASAAFTPTAGSLLVVFVKGNATRAAGSLASSVGGKTFTEITNRNYGTADRVYAYVADQTSDASSQTVTFDCTGDTATGAQIAIYEITGLSKVGTTAILQSAVNNGASGATPDITFAAAAQTGNPTLYFAAQNANAGLTKPTGWTEDFDTGSATTRIECCHRDSGFTGTNIPNGNTASAAWGAIGVEVDSSASGASTGTASITEADDAVAGAATLPISGSAAVTESDDSAAGTGTLPISGSVGAAEADDTVSATGTAGTASTGSLSVTEGDDSLAGSGTLPLSGALAATEQDDAVAATGGAPAPPSTGSKYPNFIRGVLRAG